MFTSEIRPYLLTVSGNQGDTKLIMPAVLCVCVSSPRPVPSAPPHVMPVTWFPGTQSSKSESDLIFNRSKSKWLAEALVLASSSSISPWKPMHHLPQIWWYLQHYLPAAKRGGAWHGRRWKEALCHASAHYKRVFLCLCFFQRSFVPERD